jgi:hypothetical protein
LRSSLRPSLRVGAVMTALALVAGGAGFWLGKQQPQAVAAPTTTAVLPTTTWPTIQLVQEIAPQAPPNSPQNDPRELIPLGPGPGQGPGQQPGQQPGECPVYIYQDGKLFQFPAPGQQPGGQQPGQRGLPNNNQPGAAPQELIPLDPTPSNPSNPSNPNAPSTPNNPINPFTPPNGNRS